MTAQAPCDTCGLAFEDFRRQWSRHPCRACGDLHRSCDFCVHVFVSGGWVAACPDECRAAAETLGLSGRASRWPIGLLGSVAGA